MAYARRFVAPPHGCAGEGIYVIAPGFGLVPPTWTMDLPRFRTLRQVRVDAASRRFGASLEAAARDLLSQLQPDTTVVLLGSLAPRKYLEVLWPVFGERLQVPHAFVGAGDMRRGALLLRAVLTGQELEYVGSSELQRILQPLTRRRRRGVKNSN